MDVSLGGHAGGACLGDMGNRRVEYECRGRREIDSRPMWMRGDATSAEAGG